MTNTTYILLLASLLLLSGCRARKVSVSVEATRRADSVAALRSIGSRALDREDVWETVVMLRDTLGNLVLVSREIRRHTERATETATHGDTAVFHASTEQTINQTEESVTEATKTTRRGWQGFKWGVWTACGGEGAAVVLVILAKKGVLKWI